MSWFGGKSADAAASVREYMANIEANARQVLKEHEEPITDPEFYRRRVVHPWRAPGYIATSADIGTTRAEANSLLACIDYCAEQEELKKAKAPL